MRIIKYKASDSHEFKNYVDIGPFVSDFYFFHMRGESDYHRWFRMFKEESMGAKMSIIHEYLMEAKQWSSDKFKPWEDTFARDHGGKKLSVLSSNLKYLKQFCERWFQDDDDGESYSFKGLDLNYPDIEDYIVTTKENEEGIRIEIDLVNGSMVGSKIQFLDEDVSINSLFVPEEEYEGLKVEIKKIVNLFSPYLSTAL
jgi:hypothetical protein